MGKSKTTRKDIMINTAFHALISGQSELLAIGAKYFNELMNGYGLEFNVVHFDCDKEGAWVDSENHEYHSIDDFCSEMEYWLSCYYESGHCRHEEEYKDRKAFIKYLEVFKSSCKEKHHKWVPYNSETKFLFD